ncbi:unnamed protein product [Schistosoma mattheei]|uniref:Uncharacterized protein n=1 Tax=Schistosoma mattheei TaxID=31246 RepID=A0A3P8I0Z7_9TREM|nr:unnamed protein product [Schistosoma mattheei]
MITVSTSIILYLESLISNSGESSHGCTRFGANTNAKLYAVILFTPSRALTRAK